MKILYSALIRASFQGAGTRTHRRGDGKYVRARGWLDGPEYNKLPSSGHDTNHAPKLTETVVTYTLPVLD